jgi:hypothetical protein
MRGSQEAANDSRNQRRIVSTQYVLDYTCFAFLIVAQGRSKWQAGALRELLRGIARGVHASLSG